MLSKLKEILADCVARLALIFAKWVQTHEKIKADLDALEEWEAQKKEEVRNRINELLKFVGTKNQSLVKDIDVFVISDALHAVSLLACREMRRHKVKFCLLTSEGRLLVGNQPEMSTWDEIQACALCSKDKAKRLEQWIPVVAKFVNDALPNLESTATRGGILLRRL